MSPQQTETRVPDRMTLERREASRDDERVEWRQVMRDENGAALAVIEAWRPN